MIKTCETIYMIFSDLFTNVERIGDFSFQKSKKKCRFGGFLVIAKKISGFRNRIDIRD